MAKIEKEEVDVEVIPSCLRNETLVIKFFPRPKGFVRDPKHILYGGMMDGAVKIFPAPIMRNGDYKNILTNDEKTYLENYMGLGKDGLSVYKKIDNYWDNIMVKLEKGENFFNMASPEDYIRAKIALSYDDIVAPSFDEVKNKESYMFYAVKEGEKDQEVHRKFTAKQEAYKIYGKFEDDRDALAYACKVIRGANVTKTTKLSVLQGWIGDIMEGNTKEFLLVLGDKQLRTKMLIDKGVTCGAVRFIEGQYYTADGKPLCNVGEATLGAAANYLDEPINQPARLKIETRIKATEE